MLRSPIARYSSPRIASQYGGIARSRVFEVRRADDVDAASVEIRIARQPDERLRSPPIAPPEDRDSLRICDAGIDCPCHRIEQIVIDLAAPFVVARVDEGLAETGRAAEVDAEDGVAAIGKPLMPGMENRRCRAPKDLHERGGRVAAAHPVSRGPLSVLALGDAQVRDQLEAVARFDRHRCIPREARRPARARRVKLFESIVPSNHRGRRRPVACPKSRGRPQNRSSSVRLPMSQSPMPRLARNRAPLVCAESSAKYSRRSTVTVYAESARGFRGRRCSADVGLLVRGKRRPCAGLEVDARWKPPSPGHGRPKRTPSGRPREMGDAEALASSRENTLHVFQAPPSFRSTSRLPSGRGFTARRAT